MAGVQRAKFWRFLTFLLVTVGVAWLCFMIYRGSGNTTADEMGNPPSGVETDAAPEMMPKALIDGLVLLRAEQMAKVPVVDGFQSPVGPPRYAMMYNAQGFGERNAQRGGLHVGEDWNGIGGENSDEGEPVYAAARGLVVYSGTPSADWGNVVILAHRLPGEKRIIQTLYAHLKERHVRVGQMVSRGAVIGSIGTAGGAYLAHLHFEAIASLAVEAGMPGYAAGTMNRLNPSDLLVQHPAPPVPDLFDEIRRIRALEAVSDSAVNRGQQTPQDGFVPVNPAQFN